MTIVASGGGGVADTVSDNCCWGKGCVIRDSTLQFLKSVILHLSECRGRLGPFGAVWGRLGPTA